MSTSRKGPEHDERLADWLDDRLSERDRERLEAEFRVNPELRAAAERYRATVTRVREGLAEPRASDDLSQRILARVAGGKAAAQAAKAPSGGGRILPFSLPPARVLSALAAVALVALYLGLGLLPDRVPAPGDDSTRSARLAEEEERTPPPTKEERAQAEAKDLDAAPAPSEEDLARATDRAAPPAAASAAPSEVLADDLAKASRREPEVLLQGVGKGAAGDEAPSFSFLGATAAEGNRLTDERFFVLRLPAPPPQAARRGGRANERQRPAAALSLPERVLQDASWDERRLAPPMLREFRLREAAVAPHMEQIPLAPESVYRAQEGDRVFRVEGSEDQVTLYMRILVEAAKNTEGGNVSAEYALSGEVQSLEPLQAVDPDAARQQRTEPRIGVYLVLRSR